MPELIWLDSWSRVFSANMTPPERESGFMVPTTASAAGGAGEGGEQRGGSCSSSRSSSSSRSPSSSSSSTSLSDSSGWDVEADAALLGLLGEDRKVLSEASVCVSHSWYTWLVAACSRPQATQSSLAFCVFF